MSDGKKRLSPCCNADSYDADCTECDASGDTEDGDICDFCEGTGCQDGFLQCSKCSDTFDEEDAVQ